MIIFSAIAAYCLLSAIFVVFACMLSSNISRREASDETIIRQERRRPSEQSSAPTII